MTAMEFLNLLREELATKEANCEVCNRDCRSCKNQQDISTIMMMIKEIFPKAEEEE